MLFSKIVVFINIKIVSWEKYALKFHLKGEPDDFMPFPTLYGTVEVNLFLSFELL